MLACLQNCPELLQADCKIMPTLMQDISLCYVTERIHLQRLLKMWNTIVAYFYCRVIGCLRLEMVLVPELLEARQETPR